MSPCKSDPGFYKCPQESAPDRRERKYRRHGHSCNHCMPFVITCSRMNAQSDAPFIVIVLARAILLVLNGVRELLTNVAVRAGLAALVPLLSSQSPSIRIHTPQKKVDSIPCDP
jgi:hypothetical protein